MDNSKKADFREKYRMDRCLLVAAFSLSILSIILAIAFGFIVVSLKEENFAFKAQLKSLEVNCRTGNQNKLNRMGEKRDDDGHPLDMLEKALRIGIMQQNVSFIRMGGAPRCC